MTIVFVCGDPVKNAFALQGQTTPTADVMLWGANDYNTRSSVVLIRDTMTAQRNKPLPSVRRSPTREGQGNGLVAGVLGIPAQYR
ncbi:hypothetical protein TNCV_5052761 [Trichonephila clavipes]|nr:hypothetical protein TNCV_5052761 [Trichonephila clavipes]